MLRPTTSENDGADVDHSSTTVCFCEKLGSGALPSPLIVRSTAPAAIGGWWPNGATEGGLAVVVAAGVEAAWCAAAAVFTAGAAVFEAAWWAAAAVCGAAPWTLDGAVAAGVDAVA
jgi:hypothetical protein